MPHTNGITASSPNLAESPRRHFIVVSQFASLQDRSWWQHGVESGYRTVHVRLSASDRKDAVPRQQALDSKIPELEDRFLHG
jgi:hypothetical protein